jgi:hypothetical protein
MEALLEPEMESELGGDRRQPDAASAGRQRILIINKPNRTFSSKPCFKII